MTEQNMTDDEIASAPPENFENVLTGEESEVEVSKNQNPIPDLDEED